MTFGPASFRGIVKTAGRWTRRLLTAAKPRTECDLAFSNGGLILIDKLCVKVPALIPLHPTFLAICDDTGRHHSTKSNYSWFADPRSAGPLLRCTATTA